MQSFLRIEEADKQAFQPGFMQSAKLFRDGLVAADDLWRHDAERDPDVSILAYPAPRLLAGCLAGETSLPGTTERVDEVEHGDVVDLRLDPIVDLFRLMVGRRRDNPAHSGHPHTTSIVRRQIVDVICALPVRLQRRHFCEHPIAMAHAEIDAFVGEGGVHQYWTWIAGRPRRYQGPVRLIITAFEIKAFGLRPQILHQADKLVRHVVSFVVPDRLPEAERRHLAFRIAGDDVQAPAAARDVIDSRAELGDMQRMKPVGDVRCGKQAEPLGDRRGRRGRGQKIERSTVVVGLATLTEPAPEWDLVIEPDLLGELHQPHRVRPFPVVLQPRRIA